MIQYYYQQKIKKWTVSIYTAKSDIDGSKISVLYGGGGHPAASGFSVDDISPLLL
jgi:nanoRNase/pAp phosphatase (c-di-AMP/oligoRNAs hydrolase)